MWTLSHMLMAIIALQVMPKLIVLVVAGSESPPRKIAAVLTVLLPVLTYTWLSAIWLLKLAQRSARLRS